MKERTLHDFHILLILRADMFRVYWKEIVKEFPDHYSEIMTEEEWWTEFNEWLANIATAESNHGN